MDSQSSDSTSYRSRYGIEKLQDSNYHTWSFQCQMLLAEKKVWNVVNGTSLPPIKPSAPRAEEQGELSQTELQKAEREFKKQMQDWNNENNTWHEQNDEALRIITFTVSDPLMAPIRYANGSASTAWHELQKVHAPKDKQRKYSLLKCLYRLEMKSGTTLSEHERVFDELVQSLAQIGKIIDADELIVLYAASLPNETFGNWVQSHMAVIDNLSISDFKGRVREEARRLNLAGFATNLGVTDPSVVQANAARTTNPPNVRCDYCGYKNHSTSECRRRITDEYKAMQRDQKGRGRGTGRGRGGRGRGRGRGQGNTNNTEDSNAAYSAVFGGFAYCVKKSVDQGQWRHAPHAPRSHYIQRLLTPEAQALRWRYQKRSTCHRNRFGPNYGQERQRTFTTESPTRPPTQDRPNVPHSARISRLPQHSK